MSALAIGTNVVKDGNGSAVSGGVQTYTDPNRGNAQGPVAAIVLADGTVLTPGQAAAAASLPAVLPAAQEASLKQPVPTAGTAGGATPSHTVTANTANATVVKASAGTLYAIQLANFDTSNPLCVHLYDVASTPTAGAGTVKKCLVVPPAASATQPSVLVHSFGPAGLAFGTGIAYTTTTGAADTNSSAVAAGSVIDLDYK